MHADEINVAIAALEEQALVLFEGESHVLLFKVRMVSVEVARMVLILRSLNPVSRGRSRQASRFD